jgi:hypothetical protein
MTISRKQALEIHFAPPNRTATHEFLSAFQKGLEDCRAATYRDRLTGQSLPNHEHDSWVGALGYLCLLEQIGTCFQKKGHSLPASTPENSLVRALLTFSTLRDKEIAAIYALRCAFAHDFSLFNVHPKPELTHYFRLFGEIESSIVQLPKVQWNGDFATRSAECMTSIGLTMLGDEVERICAQLRTPAAANQLEIVLRGGPDELVNRYGLMKRL